MKIFKTKAEYEAYKNSDGPQNFSKRECELVEVEGQKMLLCGTPLTEEECFSTLAVDTMKAYDAWNLAEQTGKLVNSDDDADYEYDEDLASSLRDAINETIMNHFNIKIDYISVEY